MEYTRDDSRKSYIYYLKTLAIIAVVVIHVIGDKYYYDVPLGGKWYGLLFVESLFRFAVPVFVMCSGALMLAEEREYTTKKCVSKAVKYFVIFILCTVLYVVADYLLFARENYGGGWDSFFKFVCDNFGRYKYHLWFMPMYVLLCLLTPAIRLITKRENMHIVKYLLVLFLISISTQSLVHILSVSFGWNVLDNALVYFPIMLSNYIFIFITGWFLDNNKFEKKGVILTEALITLCLSAGVNVIVSYATQTKVFFTEDNFNIFNYIFSGAIFLCFKIYGNNLGNNKVVVWLAKHTLHIYLLHVLLIEVVQQLVYKPDWSLGLLLLFMLAEVVIVIIMSALISAGCDVIKKLNIKRE